MRSSNAENERVKRDYFIYLEDAKHLTATSVDQIAAHLAAFEASTNYRSFKRFHVEQARRFKRDLHEQLNTQTGKPLAIATINARLKAVRAFFIWLAGQPGYRSKLKYSDAEYFNLSNNELRIAEAKREPNVPTVEVVFQVLRHMSNSTELERRDRALIAFVLLTGARDDAVASLSIKDVNFDDHTVFQDARHVRTKNRKTFKSWFFPVGDEVEQIVFDWYDYLTKLRGFGPDEPLFPKTEVKVDQNGRFSATSIGRTHWSNADAVRHVFRKAFPAAGLPYAKPHSLRKTLTSLGQRLCRTPEEFKVWSQNLGHEQVMTTFTSYGEVSSRRQEELFDQLRTRVGQSGAPSSDPDPETVAAVVDFLQRRAS